MTPSSESSSESEIVDPLKNLEKLFIQLVEFILINLKIVVVILSLIFLAVILLLLGFFKILGF